MKTLSIVWAVVGLMLIGGCDKTPSTQSTQSKSMANVVGKNSNNQDDLAFTPVVPSYRFEFPRDHLTHNGFRQEWWYLTANLTTETGEQLGAQWTQFRVALKPTTLQTIAPQTTVPQGTDVIAKNESTWETQQLYLAHSALTSNNAHLAHEKWSRRHSEFAEVKLDPYQIRLDNWHWQSETNALFPATLTVENSDFSYRLQLNSQAPLQYQGVNGYSLKSRDGQVASYYYSQPFIEISGEINRNGKVEQVTGQGWLDREWSSQFLTKTQQGWDWFALRLNDDSTLMLFQLRDQSSAESAKNTPISAFYSARRMFADGTGRNINSTDNPNDIQMTPLKWQHTVNGDYPVSWQVKIPSENIDLTITPLNTNSAMSLSTPYWEGPVQLSGSHTGTGYMELTGY
ncbi:carotenoid 1,2-hydratase [Shewanella sp. SW36]|uniref:lipocalin-like domain-containing protein n=1 Tax=unclassified Shewanella TaxID=196818 RepID=UPI0021DB492A|nr:MULTISPECIES: lipocalin-like domain-containing protein [unclassified Shewanella]MCU7974626.1 carotenoid 1,2-hydratase [Shewanella sp. SW36]MCU7990014.1 carotenoid 1,2-hydratase [Shewanella sp. SW1]MCU8015296.1 carotenoid 1,2-hydratase [Shewanella sp. SM72]MCU8051946.1 carotenoid 1,2-hydratase [Shewanella sp. SM43]